jgi:membrane protein
MEKSIVKGWLNIFKTAFSDFFDDRGPKLSASLAYYTIFSLPALLVVLIGLGSIFYDKADFQGNVFGYISSFVGDTAAAQVQEMLKTTTTKYNNIWATIIGVITLFMVASGVFAEIQDSINLIWRLKPAPKKGLVNFIMNRLLSFSMILVLGFILLTSLLLNALLSAFLTRLKSYFSEDLVNSLFVLDYIVIIIVIAFLFAAIFKVLPDAKIKWKDVMLGSVITTLLFIGGKFLIGFYLKKFGNISAYGAAGSVILILLWVYYTSFILYFGVEFTQAHMHHKGKVIEPYKYAMKEEKKAIHKEEKKEGSPLKK